MLIDLPSGVLITENGLPGIFKEGTIAKEKIIAFKEEFYMKRSEDLRQMLRVVDHKSYPAYKDLKGRYSFGDFILGILHVQSDPFAPPSRLSIEVEGSAAGFPKAYYSEKHCRIALQDYINRRFYQEIEQHTHRRSGSGKSGLIAISKCTQEVLERSAVTINPKDGSLNVQFSVGFPARGRTITAGQLEQILFEVLPACARNALFYSKISGKKLQETMDLSEDQQFIRRQLEAMGLCAFVANGSILPRQSGVSPLPMKGAIPFVSPKSMEVTMELPHRGRITGMGIRQGITLIVGGGFHGKSTLLKALELGVYNHIAGDGREYVITDETAFKIRAEDGRSIKKTDISMFINNLPYKKDTNQFYSENASGSTSQAANVVEAMESGTRVFLIDEDTCATNFMIRDELMQRVVCREDEPITPFVERARFLYETCGISSVLVAGSSGAYLRIADTVIQMDRYIPKDITDFAKAEAEKYVAAVEKLASRTSSQEVQACELPSYQRIPKCNMQMRKDDRLKSKSRGLSDVQLGHETIDLRYLEQLIDQEQTATLSYILQLTEKKLLNGRRDMRELVDLIMRQLEETGLPGLSEGGCLRTDLAMPRRQEIFACLNRYRGLNL